MTGKLSAFVPNWILTGIAAGLAAAAMQGAILVPSFLSVLIFLLSSLPLFVVGFSRGWASAGIGAIVAAILVMLFANLSLAISFFLTAGLAPVLAAMLSMIWRETSNDVAKDDTDEGQARSADREWYPEGRLVLWLAGVAAFITAASILTIGSDLASYEKFIGQMVAHLMTAFEKSMPAGQAPFPRDQAISLIVNALPVVASAMWLFAMFASMRLAILVLSLKNMSLRPWQNFSRMAYPANTVIALLVILAAAYFTTGIIHILILGAVGAIVAAFVLLGLAVVHGLLENNAARPMLLGLLYASLFMFSWLVAIPLTLLGLFDLNFNFRKSKTIQS